MYWWQASEEGRNHTGGGRGNQGEEAGLKAVAFEQAYSPVLSGVKKEV